MGIFDFLKKKSHDIITSDGLNVTYYKNNSKKIVKERYYSVNGQKHGEYKSYYLDGKTVNLQAIFFEGLLDGECKKWSISNPFGGGCWSYIENYEKGELRRRKVYRCAGKSPLNEQSKTRELSFDETFKKGNSETGHIEEDIKNRKKA